MKPLFHVLILGVLAAGISATGLFAADKPDVAQKAVQITLYPAAEPKPALKYQLLPPLLERRPGNAAVWWNRIPAERSDVLSRFFADNGPYDKICKWMELPIGDPQEKEIREKEIKKELIYFPDMDQAARFESCNWELPVHEGNFIQMLLPEAQQCRAYARIISANVHFDIAEGKFDQAIHKLQAGYALARHVAQGQTIIHPLVGTAIAGMMDDEVRQLIQQPDAPNLYWALSTLPRPLVDYRPGYEGEYAALYLTIPELQDLEKKTLSTSEADQLLAKVMGLYELCEVNNVKVQKPSSQEITEKIYPRAKKFLIDHGRTAAQVEAMPLAQVVLLASFQVYDEARDEMMKWCFLPYAEQLGHPKAAELKGVARSKEFLVITALLPALQSVKQAETRIQWNLAVLRIFETLRLYAAEHGGRWPDKLSDIKEVPIPVNPFDGKPFLYERHGDKAVLDCEAGPLAVPKRYEITFGRKNK